MTYRALVVGKPHELQGNGCAQAFTDFDPSIESLQFGFISELELTPLIILEHQLRIHCSLAGCPIVNNVWCEPPAQVYWAITGPDVTPNALNNCSDGPRPV